MRRDLAERIALTLVGALAAGVVAVLRGTLEASAVAPAITLLGALLCLAALLVVWVAFAVREVQRGRVPICRLIILAVGSLSAPVVLWKEVAIVGEESFPSLGWIWYVILLAASLTVAATAMSALAFLARAFRRSYEIQSGPEPSDHPQSATGEARRSWHREPWLAVSAALFALVLVWSRLVGLDQSLEHDEAFAVLNYIDAGPAGIWLGEYEPNDHVLFNVLSWVTTSVVGKSEALYRAWSALPGIAAVLVLAAWCWRRLGPSTAVVFGALITTSPVNLELVKQARGYGLVSLAAALMIISADAATAGSRRGLVGFAAAGWVGISTHLAFALGFLGQAAGLALSRIRRRELAFAIAATGTLTVAFYGPLVGQMIGDMLKYYATPIGSPESLLFAAVPGPSESRPPLPWYGILSGPISLMAPSVEMLLTGTSRPQCNALCFVGVDLLIYGSPLAVLAALGTARLWRAQERQLISTLLAPVLITFATVTLARLFVADRFVSYLLMHLFVLAAIGIVAVGAAVRRLPAMRRLAPVVFVIVGFVCAQRFLDLNSEWSATPFENPKLAAAVVTGSGIDRVVTNSERPTVFHYYLGRDGVDVLAPRRLESLFCRSTSPLIYIDHPVRPNPANTTCLDRRGASQTTVRQRGRGGRIDVWILRPSTDGASADAPKPSSSANARGS